MLGRLFKLSDSDFIELSSAVTDKSSTESAVNRRFLVTRG